MEHGVGWRTQKTHARQGRVSTMLQHLRGRKVMRALLTRRQPLARP